jgi:hypothetical protein
VNQERIQKLEALLERIGRNRSAPAARSATAAPAPAAPDGRSSPPVAPNASFRAEAPAPRLETPAAQAESPAPPPVTVPSWQPEPGSAVQPRPTTVPPMELSEDDLVEITTVPPAPAAAEASSVEVALEAEEEQPPASSSRSKVASTLDEAIATAAPIESDREIPVHTPPPESGPQEALPATGLEAPRIPDVDNLEADLSGPPSMGPTAEQLGETIELEAPRGPELEIDVTVSEPDVPAPAEELEVTLPRPSMQSGLYDVSIAEPPVAAPLPEAHVAVTVPAVATSPEGPERTGRPALGATDVAEVKLASTATPRTFVELLDASLGL